MLAPEPFEELKLTLTTDRDDTSGAVFVVETTPTYLPRKEHHVSFVVNGVLFR